MGSGGGLPAAVSRNSLNSRPIQVVGADLHPDLGSWLDFPCEGGEALGQVGDDRLAVGQNGSVCPRGDRGEDSGGGLERFFGHW